MKEALDKIKKEFRKKMEKVKNVEIVGNERRDSADIDGDGDLEDGEEKKNEDKKNDKEKKEIEERINKVNEDYFHLKYELRYFV